MRYHYGLTQVQAPSGEPVTLSEMKNWLRVDSDITQDDALINSLITSARRLIERNTNVILGNTQLLLTMDNFFGYELPGGQFLLGSRPLPQLKGGGGMWPYMHSIRFPKHPLVSVDSIKYVDTAGVLQTLDPSQYAYETTSQPGRVYPAYNTVWPVTREMPNSVKITFTAGQGSDPTTSPETFKTCIKLLVTPVYTGRGEMPDKLPSQFYDFLAIEDAGYYA